MATARGSDVYLSWLLQNALSAPLHSLSWTSDLLSAISSVFSPVNATWRFFAAGPVHAGALLDLHSQLFESVARPCMRSEARERAKGFGALRASCVQEAAALAGVRRRTEADNLLVG